MIKKEAISKKII